MKKNLVLFLLFLFAWKWVQPANTYSIDSLTQVYHTLKNQEKKLATLSLLVEEYLKTDPNKAGSYPDEEVTLALQLKNYLYLAKAYNQIGYLAVLTDHFPKAYEYLAKAEAVAKKHGLDENLAEIYNSFGALEDKQGNYSKALDYHLKAVRYYEELNLKGSLATSYKYIGILYDRQKNKTQALNYFKKALQIDRETNNEYGLGQSMNNVGIVLYDIGQKEEAARYFRQSIVAKEKVNNRRGLVSSVSNMAKYFTDRGQYDSALVYAQRCIELGNEVQSKYQQAVARLFRGEVYAKTGRKEEALKDFLEAKKITTEQGFKQERSDVLKKLAELYAQMNNPRLAYQNLWEHTAIKDSMLNEENSRILTEMQTKYETDKKEKEIGELNRRKQAQDIRLLQMDAANSRQRNIIFIAILVIGFTLLLGFFVYRGYVQKKKAHSLLHEKNLMIEEKQREIVDSINYAKRIQYTLLAHDELLKENLPEYFVLYKPKDIVSGDFYWATKKLENLNDSNRQMAKSPNAQVFYLAVCDSTGHGVPGAFMSLLNISFLNEAITEKNMTHPDQVLNHVRQRLIENISQENKTSRIARDGMDGILMKFNAGALTPGAGYQVEYAAANNHPVLIRKGEITLLPCDKMPVGYSDRILPFKTYSAEFQKGDHLYLYTDGFADQFGGPKGKKFKYKNLNALLSELSANQRFSEAGGLLKEQFELWRGDLEQVDDVCIIGIKF
jgi:serine phosphatase RsbU (regulator of sigma subunit)